MFFYQDGGSEDEESSREQQGWWEKGETKRSLTVDYNIDSRSRPKKTNKHQHIQAISVYWTGGKVNISWGNADFLLLRKKMEWGHGNIV